ncbi:hypothetical protein [Limnothrix sp. FACHB-406]|nr:hypothetical protein [Limnothrix sp. FACHB-406]
MVMTRKAAGWVVSACRADEANFTATQQDVSRLRHLLANCGNC